MAENILYKCEAGCSSKEGSTLFQTLDIGTSGWHSSRSTLLSFYPFLFSFSQAQPKPQSSWAEIPLQSNSNHPPNHQGSI